jgi:hypothetical protein
MNLKSKLFAGAVAVTMILSVAPFVASAQTSAELTAQINALLAQIASLQAQIAGGTSQVPLGSAAQGPSQLFNTDLTVGSTGSDVMALQQWLVSKGDLQMPAGVAYGYFGSITKAALAKYQASAGITPAVGYCGPITRARLNAMVGTPGTGIGTGTGTGSTGITTPGVEGTLTATVSSAGIPSTIYEGDSEVAILGAKLEAKSSDIAVQRVKLDLGTATTIYNKIYEKVYVTDGSNVLASSDLNSSTVVKDGVNYYLTIAGFSYVVPKGTSKSLVIKVDVRPSIDTSLIDTESYTVRFAANGIRGIDGAGIDQYSPAAATSISKAMAVRATLTDSASLKVSLNSSTPKRQDVVCASGSGENECDKLAILTFDLKAEKDNVLVTDMIIGAVNSGSTSGAATVATAYLFDGSTELDNAAISGGQATFNDINITVDKDTTKTLTVKVDVRTANGTVENITGYASTTLANVDVTAENSVGDQVTATGSATGNAIGIRDAGPEFTLVSKSITTSNTPQGSNLAGATSTLTASFTVKVKAVGGDVLLGTVSSGTPMFNLAGGSTGSFVVYKNGVAVTSLSNSTSTDYTIPSTCASLGSDSCLLADGSEVTIPVTYLIQGRTATVGTAAASGLYAIGLENINWVSPATVLSASTFMSGDTDWRTSAVSFP